jgi:hypothetical protein
MNVRLNESRFDMPVTLLQVPCGQGVLGARLFEAQERRDDRYHQRGPTRGLCTARKGTFYSGYIHF